MGRSLIVFILSTLFSLAVSRVAFAQDDSELFSQSRTMYQSTEPNQLYRLVLSAPKKVNSRWAFERVERLSGTVSRKTLEIDSSFSFDEINRRLEQFYQPEQSRLIYSCHGLDCGSSNAWANEVFKVKQLYGLDTRQNYEVRELSGGSVQRFAVSYLVQRGNQRVYLQLDTVTPSEPVNAAILADPKTILRQLTESGFYTIPGSLLNLAENTHLDAIAEALRMRPMLTVAVVGHSYVGQALDKKRQASKDLANRVIELLVKKGVKPIQLQAYGLGSLAPQGKLEAQRVVLVVP